MCVCRLPGEIYLPGTSAGRRRGHRLALCPMRWMPPAGRPGGRIPRNQNGAWELGADRYRFVCAPEKGQTGQLHCGGGAVSKHSNGHLRFPASCDERSHHLAETGSSRTELAGAGDRPDCSRITSWKSWCFWPDGRARGHGATSGGKALNSPRRGLLYLGTISLEPAPQAGSPMWSLWVLCERV